MHLMLYQNNGVSGGQSDDIGARHLARTSFLQRSFDGVNEIEPPHCQIRTRVLLR